MAGVEWPELVLTGLYSAFSNPVLEHLEYGMADMRLIPRRRASIGTAVSLLLERQRRCLVPPAGPLVPNRPDDSRRSFGPGGG
jgi:hypothetical protein